MATDPRRRVTVTRINPLFVAALVGLLAASFLVSPWFLLAFAAFIVGSAVVDK